MTFSWPDYFPDDCPPQDSEPASGEVYRLVKSNPPTEDDFEDYVNLYPERDFRERECRACGLSVFRDVEDASNLRDRVPAMRGHLVARGKLNSELGRMKHTPGRRQSHFTWWVPVGVECHRFFSVFQP